MGVLAMVEVEQNVAALQSVVRRFRVKFERDAMSALLKLQTQRALASERKMVFAIRAEAFQASGSSLR